MVISDYATCTDSALMIPIQINIDRVQPRFVPENTLHAVGHVWGHAVEDLLAPCCKKKKRRWTTAATATATTAAATATKELVERRP